MFSNASFLSANFMYDRYFTHRITFDSISNANLYQMIAKTSGKLSRVYYSSLSNEGLFKGYVNIPVARTNAIFIRFVESYYGHRKK